MNVAELVEWLRAELDREVAAASLIPGGGYQPARWTAHRVPSGEWSEIRQHDLPYGVNEDELPEVSTAGLMVWGRNEDEHVTRWDPARVVAEVGAKQRIVNWCAEVIGSRDLSRYGEWGCLQGDPDSLAVTLAVETIRIMCVPYADRAGYRLDWTPEPTDD
jgi:hypothetical protein